MTEPDSHRHSPPTASPLQRHWPALAAAIFAAVWIACAWKPLFPADWALENVLSLLTAWWLLRRHRRAPLSNASYALLLAFGIAHEIGSHYTYAEVPYAAWWHAVTGSTLEISRNHYDRLVHFLFGLLCYRPLREVFGDVLKPHSTAARIIPITIVATISLVYEQFEWAAALIFGGELGQAYLGTQGDVWDAQKDSGLALLGALIAASLSALHARFTAPTGSSAAASGTPPR